MTRPRVTAARAAPRRSSGRGGARSRPAARRRWRAAADRGRLRRAAAGDRPYVMALLGLLALLGAMAVGPLQSLSAAQQRVDELQLTRDELQVEVDRLEDRREDLQDPESLELMAREQLGLVMPGEVPFVVVTPEEDLPAVGPEAPPAPADRSVWEVLRDAVAALLR